MAYYKVLLEVSENSHFKINQNICWDRTKQGIKQGKEERHVKRKKEERVTSVCITYTACGPP
jgi:hypothetical protein